MYETVKEVNGYKITRMVGTRRFYWINVGKTTRVNFHTIKSAEQWALAH